MSRRIEFSKGELPILAEQLEGVIGKIARSKIGRIDDGLRAVITISDVLEFNPPIDLLASAGRTASPVCSALASQRVISGVTTGRISLTIEWPTSREGAAEIVDENWRVRVGGSSTILQTKRPVIVGINTLELRAFFKAKNP